MKDKYSQAKREQYGRRLAAHLCDQHFATQPAATLDGPAVLRFTPIRQVNLFVVQQLLAQWTGEMARLRSPYFDFEDADVRQALTQFMNVLSRRIKVTRAAFEPLLARALSDTLGLAADPAQAFEQKLLGNQPSPTVAQLRDSLRYIDIDKALFQEFIDSLATDSPLEREQVLSRFRLYQEANYKRRQPVEKLVEEFGKLLPLTEAELRESEPAATPTPVAAPAPVVQAPVAAPELAAAPAPEPEPAPAKVMAPPVFDPVPVAEPVQVAPAASVAAPRRPLAEATAPSGVPLHAKLKAEHTTTPLSETLRPERSNAMLAEKAPKVESLREAISINQRFSFINELFNGENMEYHAAIQHLDTLPDPDTAKRYVSEDLAGKYGWVRKEEHVNKLLKLIDRKFA
ncbi:hypothetical protein [Hymenobacter jejuensis]|uniref:Uncharacterized protein n=1 Tax=Hymenobacter jejuensis TaxID=2502781 RepID=A0A5B7ZWR9_9BACT|nr:hypothetical protein [Hymenobacter jejuensis]QDA59604.1 hypothetical protein FHG12_05540 [Hymenobacter jejuensis]